MTELDYHIQINKILPQYKYFKVVGFTKVRQTEFVHQTYIKKNMMFWFWRNGIAQPWGYKEWSLT